MFLKMFLKSFEKKFKKKFKKSRNYLIGHILQIVGGREGRELSLLPCFIDVDENRQ
jgi:hypothetical protein